VGGFWLRRGNMAVSGHDYSCLCAFVLHNRQKVRAAPELNPQKRTLQKSQAKPCGGFPP